MSHTYGHTFTPWVTITAHERSTPLWVGRLLDGCCILNFEALEQLNSSARRPSHRCADFFCPRAVQIHGYPQILSGDTGDFLYWQAYARRRATRCSL